MKGITKLDIEINVDLALNYYKNLEENFQKQKWQNISIYGDPNNKIEDMYGWSLDTLFEMEEPFMPTELHQIRDYQKYKRTVCCIGWGLDLMNFFSKGYKFTLVVSPPGSFVAPHTDDNEKCKIHIPIQTNEKCTWNVEDEIFSMPAGSAYLLDVSYTHSTINNSDINRIHIIGEYLSNDIPDLLKLKGKI